MTKILTVKELRVLIEKLPEYYDDIPVSLLVENRRFSIFEAKSREETISSSVVENSFDLICGAKLTQKPIEKSVKKKDA